MQITHQSFETNGAFVAQDQEVKVGEMTYSKAGTDKIIIDHTEVDPSQNGKGIGMLLLTEAVNYARTNALKIIPLCPFAKKMFDKHTDIKDVLFA